MRRVLLIAAMVALAGCTDETNARRVLEDSGYTDVRLGGYAFFACSEDDIFRTSFEARGANGRTVRGTVCKGWFKGSTIRLD